MNTELSKAWSRLQSYVGRVPLFRRDRWQQEGLSAGIMPKRQKLKLVEALSPTGRAVSTAGGLSTLPCWQGKVGPRCEASTAL